MRKRNIQKLFLALPFYLVGWIFSQANHLYYHERPTQVYIGEEVAISQLMFTDEPIAYGMLFFRDKGELSYQEVRMFFEAGKWVGYIPAHRVTKQGLEYVTVLTTKSGGRIALPLTSNPFDTPLEIKVLHPLVNVKDESHVSRQKKSSKDSETNFVDADILILSPEDGSMNRPDEVVISASLFNAPNIDQSSLQFILDGEDLTEQALISGDVLSLVPKDELDVGLHSVTLRFKTTYGIDVFPVEWSFNVNKGMENISQAFVYKGFFNAKTSSSTASSITIDEKENSGKIDGELSWIKARYSFRNSSRESVFSQPLNRSTLSLQITDYLKVENGDVYPSVSPYVLDGKRVDGRHIHANVNYDVDVWRWNLKGAFEFQYVNGKFAREVQYQPGIDRAYKLLTDGTLLNDDGTRLFKIDRKGYTFPRDVVIARMGFSLLNKYRGGFHFLKSKDDFEKISVSAPAKSLFTIDSTVLGDSVAYYTLTSLRDTLRTQGDSVVVKKRNWGDGSPEENLVLGWEFEAAIDNRKLLFQTGWNMSYTNSNIWAGTANKDSLDLMLDTLSDGKIMEQYDVTDIGDMIEEYEDIFTVHPFYMSPIAPIDPLIAEKSPFKAFLNMPGSAYYLRVKGSYSFNNILIEYKQLGPEYKSFGNPYLTTNLREFIINDRLSLLGRRLMIVAAYKYRDNNLSETVANPIASKTFSFNTTLVPGPGAPSIILNIQSIGRTNGVDSLNLDQYGNYLGDNREDTQALNIMGSVNLPGTFGQVNTTTSINVNSITYSDNLAMERLGDYLFQKSETQSLSITFSTRFQFPLKTSSTFNRTQLFLPYVDKNNNPYTKENVWTTFNTNAQYSIFRNRVRFRGGLDFMTNGETDNTSTKLYGGKLGCDIDIIYKLTMSFNSSIRMNDINGKRSVNSSGFNLSLGYRF